MARWKGNWAWRPQTLTPQQIAKIAIDLEKYIEKEEDPTIVWFTSSYPPIILKDKKKMYINKDYISDHKEFSELRRRAIEKQEAYLQKWATKNTLNATMSVFRLKQPQHWFTDRIETNNKNVNIEIDELTQEDKEIIEEFLSL